jgi:hypothetical protein
MYQKSEVLLHSINNKKRQKMNQLSLDELVQNKTRFPTVVIPRVNDGSASHAVVVVDNIIFDATQSHAMKLCKGSFDWTYGKGGIGAIERALHFEMPHETKKRYARTMTKNW